MNMFEVWLLLVFLPNLLFVGVMALVAGASLLIFPWVIYAISVDCEYNEREKLRKRMENRPKVERLNKIGVTLLIIGTIMSPCIPSKKEMAAIVLIPYVSNNPEFKKLPENIVGVLNDLIKEYRKELSPENKELVNE